ncbi:volume-regulated anion channel subunit LRRC8A-like [Discoglossus pictus]
MIEQWCYDIATTWYSKYFPYMVCVHSMIFMVCANFWFKFPGTSSKIEHFISILFKCLDSQWTTRAISETVYEHSDQKPVRDIASKRHDASSTDDTTTPSVITQPVRRSPSTKLSVAVDPTQLERSTSKIASLKANGASGGQPVTILDKKEAEQAKALFEKVKKFRLHTEDGDILYTMYISQTIVRCLQTLGILAYVSYFTPQIRYIIHCKEDTGSTGCTDFYCLHGLQRMFKMYSYSYIGIVTLYFCTCLYSLYWIFFYKLKEYSFENVREETNINDIPDVKNDFAFLLHLIDQYDSLYASNFAVFLSDVSENKLLQLHLTYEWTEEKLRQRITINNNNKKELHLFMMTAIPTTLYEITDLEVLKIELVTDANIQNSISKLEQLNEIWISNTNVKVETKALHFLKEKLEVLHIRFENPKEIPAWIFSLKNLRELFMEGNLQLDYKTVTMLRSFRELEKLRTLSFRSNFTKVPSVISDVANHLQNLTINNQKIKLLSLTIIKKLSALSQLKLIHCGLDRIPSVVFSLFNLQELDLKENCLTGINEVAGFQNLKKFTSLKLQSNAITEISPHIAKVTTLESLSLNKNKITELPISLFRLYKLKNLALAYNSISAIPKEISRLLELQVFTIEHNIISELPEELFECIKLRVLIIAYNQITVIPPAIGKLVHLRHLELNDNKLERLPAELGNCRYLRRRQFAVEEAIYNTLPPDVREEFLKI